MHICLASALVWLPRNCWGKPSPTPGTPRGDADRLWWPEQEDRTQYVGPVFIDGGIVAYEGPQRPAGQQAHRARRSACSRRASVCKAIGAVRAGHSICQLPRAHHLQVVLAVPSPTVPETSEPPKHPDGQTLCYPGGPFPSPRSSSRLSVVSAGSAVLSRTQHMLIPSLDYFPVVLLQPMCCLSESPNTIPKMGWGCSSQGPGLRLNGIQTLGALQTSIWALGSWPGKGTWVGSSLLSTSGDSPAFRRGVPISVLSENSFS